ncbi:hypothetical protein AB0A70_08095 [Streptomyces morookaense]|uniref:hypothetical protein n=1 Tax=Streptomyces morookaense TaxID=1970 RepID=UPI0034114F0B
MLDPSGIYLFTGDFDALEKDAAALKKDAGSIRDTGGDIHSQFQGLASYYHAPEADQLFKTTLPVRDKAKDFGGDLEKVSSALTEFASEGRPLADKLKSLKHEAEQFLASVKDDKDWQYDGKKKDHHNRIRDDIDAAVAAFQAAELRCANKITGLYKGGTHWVTDDGTHQDNMYGFKAEDLKHAKVPWGEPVEQKHHWWEVGHWIKSFVWDGIVVDGIWGTVKGLGTLVGVDGWDKAGQAWTGLAKLATGLAISSLPGVGTAFWAMPADKLPSWLRDSRTAVKETGKALVAWDEWSKNPARAAGGVTFNVLTTVFTGGSGTAAKAGAVAKTVSVLGKAGKFIDPMTYIGKGLGKGMSALNISVPKVGDLMAGLRDSLGGNKVSPASLSLPHDMNIHVPEAPSVPTVHDTSVKFPDGTTLHENGTMVSPAGKPHTEPIPVELNAADRIEHQQIATSTASHAPTHVKQPALAHVGGTADNAAHVGSGAADDAAAHTSGHAGETPLPSADRGSEGTAAHTGGHTAEPTAHTGDSHTPGSTHTGSGADNTASHTGARGTESGAHTGSHGPGGAAEDAAAHTTGKSADAVAHPSVASHAEPTGGGASDAPHHAGHDSSGADSGHGAGGQTGRDESQASHTGHEDVDGSSHHEANHGGDPRADHAPMDLDSGQGAPDHQVAAHEVDAAHAHAIDPAQTMRSDYIPPDAPESRVPVPPKEPGDIVLATGDHVYHEPSLTTIGYDSMTQLNRDLTARLDGYHDVVVHGNNKGYFMPGRKNLAGVDFPPGEVHATHIAEAIRNNPTYKGGPVRLISCHTGRVLDGVADIPAAQKVANDLGVPVMAPTDEVGVYPSRPKGQEPEVQNGGYWRTFLPMVD